MIADTWLRDYTAARVPPGRLASLDRALADPKMTYEARLVLIACTIHADEGGHFKASEAKVTRWVNEILEAARREYQP